MKLLLFLILVVALSSAGAEPACEEGWTSFESACYIRRSPGSIEACGTTASAVSIHSPEENEFVLGLAKTGVVSAEGRTCLLGLFWGPEGINSSMWYDATLLDYLNWGPGEPGPTPPELNQWAVMVTDVADIEGTWKSIPLTSKSAADFVVCKKYATEGGDDGDFASTYKPSSDTTDEPAPTSCEDGWTLFNNTCFIKLEGPASANEAAETCRSKHNADPVEIHSAQENEFVAELTRTGVQYNDATGTSLGLFFAQASIPGLVYWNSAEPGPVDYTNFISGGMPRQAKEPLCTAMILLNGTLQPSGTPTWGKWRTLNCTERVTSFVCMKKLYTPKPPNHCGDWGADAFFDGKCFARFANGDQLTPTQAFNYCSKLSNGAQKVTVASIHSAAQNEFIEELAKTYSDPSVGGAEMLIGLVLNGTNGQPSWSDGSTRDYFIWWSGFPNASKGEKLTVMITDVAGGDEGKWKTVDTTSKLALQGVVCQKNAA